MTDANHKKYHIPKFRMDWMTFTLALVAGTIMLTLIPAHYLVILLTHKIRILDSLNKQPLLKVSFAAVHSVFFAFTAGLRRKRVVVPDKHLLKQFDDFMATNFDEHYTCNLHWKMQM